MEDVINLIKQLERSLKKTGFISQENIDNLESQSILGKWFKTADSAFPIRYFKVINAYEFILKIAESWDSDINTREFRVRLVNRYLFDEDIEKGELVKHGG